jgi:Uri superfamily endonuclease
MSPASIVRSPGAYILLVQLPRARGLVVGRLGTYAFPSGWYAYAGSALGGVEQRVARHLRESTVRHWHMLHLLGALQAPASG